MSKTDSDTKENMFLKFWNGLSPQNKRNYSIITIVGLLIVIVAAGYQVNRGGKQAQTAKTGNEHKVIDLHSKLLDKTDLREKEKDLTEKEIELKEKDARMKEMEKRLAEIQSGKYTAARQPDLHQKSFPELPPIPGGSNQPVERSGTGNPGQGSRTLTELPAPPSLKDYPQIPPPRLNTGPRDGAYKGEQDTEIGDIAIVSNAVTGGTAKDADQKRKKKEQKIYLPPSYMEATLLSGLDAPTSTDGKSAAAPTLLRIAAPAVLPNEVKMQLKGCFVIAECTGNLSSERADCRLISLSCLARDGRAVIDQKVKGFLVDQDGKIGLAGNVVAKMGSMLARSALAGFFGGVGKAFQASSTPTAITTAGIVQLPDTESTVKAGIGSGVAQASQDLQKFYLDLGRQTLPVIEVGAAKHVTLVTSEGVDLDIKLHCDRKNAFGEAVCDEVEE